MSTTTIDASDFAVVHELKMSTLDMGWLARGLLAAASKDEVFGVRCHAHIVADGFTAVATTTDGFRIHQMHLPLRGPVAPVDVVIPREALVWAHTFTPKKDSLIEPIATIVLMVSTNPERSVSSGWVSVIYREWDDDAAPSARFDGPLIADAYPRTDVIIDGARVSNLGGPAPVNLDLLADARALQTAETEAPTPTFTTSEKTGRPGPVILDFWESGVLRATALIQPARTGDEDEG